MNTKQTPITSLDELATWASVPHRAKERFVVQENYFKRGLVTITLRISLWRDEEYELGDVFGKALLKRFRENRGSRRPSPLTPLAIVALIDPARAKQVKAAIAQRTKEQEESARRTRLSNSRRNVADAIATIVRLADAQTIGASAAAQIAEHAQAILNIIGKDSQS